ncbi:MAG: alpha/beta fold hydrolase [Acaryochloridaceae cyanobacterium CSU_5_19]|nr:alpha/beta fold hydrolase [Acaryochloridaceae cyanobacterium CSU_5_19]
MLRSQPLDNPASQPVPSQPPSNLARLKTWGQPGPYPIQKLTFNLEDKTPKRIQLSQSSRQFPVDLYLPQTSQRKPSPVVVISHGLGSSRSAYVYFANHLASHGFVVAVPEHPGSSVQYFQALLAGQVSRDSGAEEFIDRPLDVSFMLDDLKVRSQTDPRLQGRLDLEQVGVAGHSYGGYTALALAGATINFNQLQQDCGPALQQTLNISLFLQCQALSLPPQNYNFTDARVKAILTISPITQSIFGPSQLKTLKLPILLLASGADTITPTLLEQLRPFTWLNSPHKYLALIEKA